MSPSTSAVAPDRSLWVSLEYSLKVMELRREIMDVFRGLVPIYLPKQKRVVNNGRFHGDGAQCGDVRRLAGRQAELGTGLGYC